MCDHRYLHGLTHAFPTRRSSELRCVHIEQQCRLGQRRITLSLALLRQWPQCVGCLQWQIGHGVTQLCGFRRSLHGVSSAPSAALLRADSTRTALRSEEHTSELQSLMRNSYAVFCLKKKIRYTKMIRSQNT